ncbi:MAG: UMP kinase [SAR116 cluster bacterium]|nr:UMP kinase [SAR116 cluster bacterium]RPH12177.1 MAG: UMP kinase [Alphaproteobacteria bacterium TMED54]
MKDLYWKRILLKLSGEALMGNNDFGISPEMLQSVANEIKDVVNLGAELCIVLGGGNIFRGITGVSKGMDRTTGDYMGMLATVMNSLALQNSLEKLGVPTRVQSALPISAVSEPYIRRRADRHLEKNRVVIFAAGTGNPYFTTDTAAALRASEMNCNVLIKATLVDGIYTADPKVDKNAQRYNSITYMDVLSKDLKVIDAAAVSLARENNIPIIISSIFENGNLLKICKNNKGIYTIVK